MKTTGEIISKLEPEAPIIPAQSLGGVMLGSSIKNAQNLIARLQAQYISSGNKNFVLTTPYEARYEFKAESIVIWVDVRNGKIYQLTGITGYQGMLFGSIYVGMKVEDAITINPSLYYDENLGFVSCRGSKGLAINLPELDPLPELVPKMIIESISVYVEEAFTPKGNAGMW
jgi:hypothetical protein